MEATVSSRGALEATRAWVGRQPIFDRTRNLVAYELLYRSGPDNRAAILDADQASSRTLLNAFLEMGIDELCGTHRAYVNLTRELLMSEAIEVLPKHRVVLEVLETVRPDRGLVARLRALRDAGYRLALDDYVLDERNAELLDLADVVKLDLRMLSREELGAHVREVKARGAELLAEKVETEDEFARCRALGFHYFQGYYLSLPEVRSQKRAAASRAGVLRLLTKVQSTSTTLAELEEIFAADVSLTYRVLRFLNSSVFARAHRIDSVHHALVMLGRERLRRWVTLIALAGLDDRPPPVLTTALVRARMCERLAEVARQGDPSSAFSVGLFSALDALLGMSLSQVLAQLPLTDELNDALVDRRGPLGRLLRAALDYEAGEWRSIDMCGLPAAAFPEAYFGAVRWAEDHLRELAA